MTVLVRHLEKPGALVSSYDSHQLKSGYVLLEPGKEVGEHKTEGGEELIVVMDGSAELLCGGEVQTIRAPAVALIPAHTLHNVKNKSKSLLKYVYVVATNRS
jgi:quercetin dioxygenase-like cupin family protein